MKPKNFVIKQWVIVAIRLPPSDAPQNSPPKAAARNYVPMCVPIDIFQFSSADNISYCRFGKVLIIVPLCRAQGHEYHIDHIIWMVYEEGK